MPKAAYGFGFAGFCNGGNHVQVCPGNEIVCFTADENNGLDGGIGFNPVKHLFKFFHHLAGNFIHLLIGVIHPDNPNIVPFFQF